MLPWERPNAPEHVRVRQPVMEIKAAPGPRADLPKRQPADELPPILRKYDLGVVVMTHRGSSNGRLSVLLSSIPDNYPVTVCSDSVAQVDIDGDEQVARYHRAAFSHLSPWGGRAANAIHCMKATNWPATLYLCDDVWLFPECIRDALRNYHAIKALGVPLAVLGVPGWETFYDLGNGHRSFEWWGFKSWDECLLKPWMFHAVPPNPAYRMCPALYKNPFGACMLMNREAYEDLGGFSPAYWAHDDVYNHKVWLSYRWVNAAYPGRGYMHLGAQSWHHGEAQEYVNQFKDATGMTADESGAKQVEAIYHWRALVGGCFEQLGGSPAV